MLMGHGSLWVHEFVPHIGMLTRLTKGERALFEEIFSMAELATESALSRNGFPYLVYWKAHWMEFAGRIEDAMPSL